MRTRPPQPPSPGDEGPAAVQLELPSLHEGQGLVDVGRSAEFGEGRGRRVLVDGQQVAIFRHQGKVYALRDRCPHAAAALSPGVVQRGAVECPRHGIRFSLATGAVLNRQTVLNVERFAVQEHEGRVLVSPHGERLPATWD